MLTPKITEQISCMNPRLVGRETTSQLIPMSSPVFFILYAIQYLQYWSGAGAYGYLSFLLDKHFPIYLTKAQTSQGPPHHIPELNQTVYQILFVMYFLPTALKLDLGATDFSQSYLGVLPCFDSHFVEIALHDSVILLNNAENFPCQWYSSSH